MPHRIIPPIRRTIHTLPMVQCESIRCSGASGTDLPLVSLCSGRGTINENGKRQEMVTPFLLHTTEGRGSLRVGAEQYPLTPHSCVLMYDAAQSLHAVAAQHWAVEYVAFAPEQMDYVFRRVHCFPVYDCPLGIFAPYQEAQTRRYPKLHEFQLLSALLSDLMIASNRPAKRFDDIVIFLHQHLHKNLTLDEMARHVNLSKFYFLRQFKAKFASTPARYQNNLRINRARQLLRDNTETLERIAEACGFHDANHLIRAFKQATQETPGAYRKRMRNG